MTVPRPVTTTHELTYRDDNTAWDCTCGSYGTDPRGYAIHTWDLVREMSRVLEHLHRLAAAAQADPTPVNRQALVTDTLTLINPEGRQ